MLFPTAAAPMPDLSRRALLSDAITRLRLASVEAPERNAEWLLSHVIGVGRAHLLAYPEALLSADEAAQYEAFVARRLAREPLQYVTGEAHFYGLALRVEPAVLIPRPETEEVVEAALATIADADAPWVLDIGTGSGAIALAVKHERPDAEVFAVDVSAEALDVAMRNAQRLDLDVAFVHADLFDPRFTERVENRFDLVLSNPPYVPDDELDTLQPEVRDFEPEGALVTGGDPLRFYRALAVVGAELLKPGGWLVVETHADYGRAVRDLYASEEGFGHAALRQDLARRDRIVLAQQPAHPRPE
ncbi:MAG: peptide chain release factor N(5)-glutamine methyltransferase [Bacteroidota bacterium]